MRILCSILRLWTLLTFVSIVFCDNETETEVKRFEHQKKQTSEDSALNIAITHKNGQILDEKTLSKDIIAVKPDENRESKDQNVNDIALFIKSDELVQDSRMQRLARSLQDFHNTKYLTEGANLRKSDSLDDSDDSDDISDTVREGRAVRRRKRIRRRNTKNKVKRTRRNKHVANRKKTTKKNSSNKKLLKRKKSKKVKSSRNRNKTGKRRRPDIKTGAKRNQKRYYSSQKLNKPNHNKKRQLRRTQQRRKLNMKNKKSNPTNFNEPRKEEVLNEPNDSLPVAA